MRDAAIIALCLLLPGCAKQAEVVERGATTDVRHRHKAIAVAAVAKVETLATEVDKGEPASGAVYDSSLAANVLPDAPAASPVKLAPNDATDESNYQAAGWWLRLSDRSRREHSRFLADFDRYTSGVLVFKIDTLLDRTRLESPFESALADSIAIGGLGALERFSLTCRFGQYRGDERLVAVVPDTTPVRWMRPRVAWIVDTVAVRIRRIRPDALSCMLEEDPD